MDHQCDSGWIEPLEATALSAHEEKETQTPVFIEGDVSRTESDEMVCSCVAGGDAGAPIMGGVGGCRKTPPLISKTE